MGTTLFNTSTLAGWYLDYLMIVEKATLPKTPLKDYVNQMPLVCDIRIYTCKCIAGKISMQAQQVLRNQLASKRKFNQKNRINQGDRSQSGHRKVTCKQCTRNVQQACHALWPL